MVFSCFQGLPVYLICIFLLTWIGRHFLSIRGSEDSIHFLFIMSILSPSFVKAFQSGIGEAFWMKGSESMLQDHLLVIVLADEVRGWKTCILLHELIIFGAARVT